MNKSQLVSCVRVATYWRKLTWLLLLSVTGLTMNAQTVAIGTGTLTASGTNGTPIYRSSSTSSFHHSKSIQLLTAAQLATAGLPSGATINQWGYYKANNGAPSGANAWTLNVYLKNSTATALASGTSWNTMITGATLAYTATITSANMPAAIGYWMWPTTPFLYTGGAIEAYVEWFPAGTMTSPFTSNSFLWQYTSAGNQAMGTSSSTAIAGTNTSWSTQARFYNTRISYTAPLPCSGTPAVPTISPAGPMTKCAGQSQAMSASGASTGTGISYQWEVSGTGGGAGFAPIPGATTFLYTASALTAGTYYYRMMTTCAASGQSTPTAELMVQVNPLPLVNVTPSSANVCGGVPQQLDATGATTYAWSPATGLSASSGATVIATPIASTSYTVTGTDGNGCTSTSVAALTVNQGITLNGIVSATAAICPLGSTSLQANASFLNGAYCQSTHSSGCSGDNIVSVTFNTLYNTTSACGLTGSTPPRYIYQSGPSAPTTTLVAGSTYTMTLSFGSDGNQYFGAWIDFNQNGQLETTEFSGASANAGANGTTSVSFLIPAGAYNGVTRLRVIGGNDAVLNATHACGNSNAWGETQDYDVTITGGVDPFSYTWSESPANGTLSSLTGNPVSANMIPSTTTYSVTATTVNGCSTTGSITMNILPLNCLGASGPASICDGQNFSLTANHTGGGAPYSYVWDDGAAGVYPNAQVITANLPAGTYSYTVTVTDGCGNSCSSPFTFQVNALSTGVEYGPTSGLTYESLTYYVNGYNPTDNFQWQFATSPTGPWTNIGTNNDSLVTSASTAGTFYIQCIITNAALCSFTTPYIATVIQVAGDHPCSPMNLPLGISGPYTNVGAGIEPGEVSPPASGCNVQNGWCSGQVASHSIWFTFVAPPSGKIQIGNAGALWDNEFAIWTVEDCADFGTYALVAANDDSASSPFNARITSICLVPGQTYYLQVDGYGAGTNGDFYINLVNETAGVRLAAKAMLSGPYNTTNGLMNDDLRTLGMIPATEPYTSAPFNKPVLGGAAGETVSPAVLAVTGNDAIVDWVFIELRNAANPSSIIATKRALIQRDGDIVNSADGLSPLTFPTLSYGNYFVAVKHRNHLGIMTAIPVALGPCDYGVIDLTTSALWVKAGEVNGPARVIGNIKALWSSDANYNKNAKYNGLSNDKEAVLNALGGAAFANNTLGPVYRPEDLNMDGLVRYNNVNNDRNVIANTIGVSTPNNIVNQHTPN